MELFHIELIAAVLHLTAFIFSLFSVFKQWGYYWILPSFASFMFFIDVLYDVFASAAEIIILEGLDLLRASFPALGALVWLVSLIILYRNLFTLRFERASRKILLDRDASPENFRAYSDDPESESDRIRN
ncbi:MAG: hypothetical protein K9L21_00210 [Spirochaetia bacterium]|nr:hypothetical protein [Spirochaetia bacterium]